MPREILTLDVEAIRELSNYAHWIPMVRGYTRDFMERKYPGWEWNELIPRMLSKGIIRTEPQADDVKLWQGLWLKDDTDQVLVTKSSGRISFRTLPGLSEAAATVKG